MTRRRHRRAAVPDPPRERSIRSPVPGRTYADAIGGPSAGCFRTVRLPTADEQARGEWPDRDDEGW